MFVDCSRGHPAFGGFCPHGLCRASAVHGVCDGLSPAPLPAAVCLCVKQELEKS